MEEHMKYIEQIRGEYEQKLASLEKVNSIWTHPDGMNETSLEGSTVQEYESSIEVTKEKVKDIMKDQFNKREKVSFS